MRILMGLRGGWAGMSRLTKKVQRAVLYMLFPDHGLSTSFAETALCWYTLDVVT